MNRHLSTIIVSAITAFGVAGVATPADTLEPAPIPRPSAQQQIDALKVRLDRVQRREAVDRSSIHAITQAVNDALDVTQCIDGAVPVTMDAETGALSFATTDDEDATVVATISADCVG